MTITLPAELEQRVRDSIASGDYLSAEELVQHAIEKLLSDDEDEAVRTETLIREARESGQAVELTADEWDQIEQEALTELSRRQPGTRAS